MINPYRLLSAGVLAAFGVSAIGLFATNPSHPAEDVAPPALLPAVYANPVETASADTLYAGETLSQLLLRAELAEAESRALLEELREHQDPRRLHPGAVISYRRSYTDGAVRAVEFRLDADRVLNVARSAGEWVGEVEEVPVHADTVVLAGEVRSSLYNALLGGEGSGVPARERVGIADILAERVFAWQIDFSRDLRSGDEFRILYERMVRPDGSARSGRVVAVQFRVNGRDYEGYHFAASDGTEDYYDREGESLRRAFLRAPLEFRRISSAYSTGRFHPILKKKRAHHGIDYAASRGTPIRAVGDGTVTRAGRAGGYGNLIAIRHTRGYSTRYAHLKGFADGIRTGVRVKQGDIIGYVGSTGLSTGPHLHFEFRENGAPINPKTIEQITGDPIPGRHREAFLGLVATQVAALDHASQEILLADAAASGRSRSVE